MKKYKIKNTFNTSYKSSGYEDEELYEKEFDTLEDLEDLEELKNLLRDVDEDNFGNPFVNDRKEVNNEKIKNIQDRLIKIDGVLLQKHIVPTPMLDTQTNKNLNRKVIKKNVLKDSTSINIPTKH